MKKKKGKRLCFTCGCELSIYNPNIQCRPCQRFKPIGESDRWHLRKEIEKAESEAEAQLKFLQEQEALEAERPVAAEEDSEDGE